MKAVAPTTFARMSESLMSRKPLHKRLSRGFATCRSLPPIVGKNWRQKLPDGSSQGCEIPVKVIQAVTDRHDVLRCDGEPAGQRLHRLPFRHAMRCDLDQSRLGQRHLEAAGKLRLQLRKQGRRILGLAD